MFNREFGTLENIIECTQEVKLIIRNRNEQSIKEKQQIITEKRPTVILKGRKRKLVNNEKEEKKKLTVKEKEVSIHTKPTERDQKKSVFISNLHQSVNENTLKMFFPNCVNIELVKDKRGNSKCFGFVQFKTEEDAMVALARDREPIDGRPVFISELKSSKIERKSVFKYATTTEENKLFVRGLPIKKDKHEIEELFKKFGDVNVRLVLHKSGEPRGLAYVEFRNKESANRALNETDNLEIDGHKISVEISAPPPKKEAGVHTTKSFKPIRHARSKLQVPLIPRIVWKKSGEEETGSNTSAVSKSNADFRTMFLKQ